jgi:hypothetical protein
MGMQTAFNVLMSVAHEKLRNRIYVHENYAALSKLHPELKSQMPVEFEGSNKSIKEVISDWKQDLIDHRQWFLDDEQYGVKFSAQKNDINVGSFRQLDID